MDVQRDQSSVWYGSLAPRAHPSLVYPVRVLAGVHPGERRSRRTRVRATLSESRSRYAVVSRYGIGGVIIEYTIAVIIPAGP